MFSLRTVGFVSINNCEVFSDTFAQPVCLMPGNHGALRVGSSGICPFKISIRSSEEEEEEEGAGGGGVNVFKPPLSQLGGWRDGSGEQVELTQRHGDGCDKEQTF